jgi:hypothetical protein
MARAALVAHTHEAGPYVPRIRRLLDEARVKAARDLLAEAFRAGSQEPELAQLAALLAPPAPKPSPVRDFDRSAEFRWLAEHGEAYMGQWVAVLGDQLIAHAPTLQDLQRKLDRTARDKPVLVHHLA